MRRRRTWAGRSVEEITALAVQPPPEGTEPDWLAGPDNRWVCRECNGVRVGTFPCTSDQCEAARRDRALNGQSRGWVARDLEIEEYLEAKK